MTAEVAILNAGAIAIAADSAVTTHGGKKIYNSALKVFALSKVAPVGVMIYGNANLMGVPWETIIKMYRRKLGATVFEGLHDYAENLMEFICDVRNVFSEDSQDSWSRERVSGYLAALVKALVEEVEGKFSRNEEVSEQGTLNVLRRLVERDYQLVRDLPFALGSNEESEAEFREKFKLIVTRLIAKILQKLPYDGNVEMMLQELAIWIHTRDYLMGGETGLVVCGFGEDDVYPKLFTYEIEGVYDGRVKGRYMKNESYSVRSWDNCAIIPFAQKDVVFTFMEGMNPAIDHFIKRLAWELISRLPDLILDSGLARNDAEREAFKERYGEASKRLLGGFINCLDLYKREQHIDPIFDMVRVLPKDEMAAMAEAMVSLTAFKRRMTNELETVGGPVDVAVISKGDGFVWVKRKHYFKPELNQHFFSNYFRGIGDGEH